MIVDDPCKVCGKPASNVWTSINPVRAINEAFCSYRCMTKATFRRNIILSVVLFPMGISLIFFYVYMSIVTLLFGFVYLYMSIDGRRGEILIHNSLLLWIQGFYRSLTVSTPIGNKDQKKFDN